MSSDDSAPIAGATGYAPVRVVEDFAGLVQLLCDSTVIRRPATNVLPPPSVPPTVSVSVQWKDVVYDPNHDLKLRIYKPTTTTTAAPCAAESSAADGKKLPVLVFFHGGGFCIGSFDLPNIHACCLRLADELPALVLSADYRLAPEHRLPAAHEDARTLVSWIRAQAAADSSDVDPWLAESADFRNVFVSGESAGANIAHHVAVAVGSGEHRVDDPARVAGHALFWPFFAGVRRTASEAEYPPGPLLTLPVSDQLCRLSLPAGATRDHPALNPFGPRSPALDAVTLPPTLVVVAQHDLLRDRAADYVTRLKAMDKPVALVEFEGQHHGFFVVDPYGDSGDELVRVVRRFVYGSMLPA